MEELKKELEKLSKAYVDIPENEEKILIPFVKRLLELPMKERRKLLPVIRDLQWIKSKFAGFSSETTCSAARAHFLSAVQFVCANKREMDMAYHVKFDMLCKLLPLYYPTWLTDFINDLTDTENKEITLDNGQTINMDDYVSASSLIDMAIKMSDDYSYDMSGSLDAQVNCDIDSVDWKSLVTANDADFDVDTAEGDLSLLTEIEPFTIPDSIVVQADASTGELNYLAEPELSFAYPEKEAEEADDADETADTDETADAEDDLMSWIVKDEAGSSEQPNLVIKGEFKGMGPLAIFTKDAK